MWNSRLDESQVGIKIAGRNINNLRYADDTNLMAESKEQKSFLMIMKEKREKLAIAQHSKYKGRGIWSHQFMANILGKNGNSDISYFIGLQNHCKWWLQPWNQKTLAPWEKNYDKPRQHIKKERHYFTNKGPSSQSYGFSNGHVWMWELDYKESWEQKNWCFWTVLLEKTLESPLDCTEIQPVQFSRSVESYSLQPHELQHARPPCPSPTPGAHSDSCPSSQWCHPAISSSVVPFYSCPQSLPTSECFPMTKFFTWGGQSTGVSALASFLPKKSQS